MLIPGRRSCCTLSQSLSSVAEMNPGQVVGLIQDTNTINTLNYNQGHVFGLWKEAHIHGGGGG